MSAKICGLVWELELPREEKFVLLCLGDHSDHDGNNVFPSIGLIAWKTDYSERRIQELMRRLEHRGLLVKVEEQFGRGKTTVYRIDLAAGTFKEARRKGAKISPFSGCANSGKGEIPQGERVKPTAQKGETPGSAIRKNRHESKTLNLFPPTPQRGVSDIWQAVLLKLKDDFASAYIFNKHFQEEKFDKHFRDSWLIKIEDGVAFLDSPQPHALADGLRQFHQRVSKTFLAVAGFEVNFQLGHSSNICSPRGESDSDPLRKPESSCA